MSTAGKAVFLSALTVVMSLAAVFLVPVMVFRSMALGMILSVVAVAARVADPPPGAARRARRPGPRAQGHARTPTSPPKAAGPRWTGVALPPARRRARRSVSSLLGALDRPRARHAPRHARRQGRRQGQHEPRRLRHARLRVRSRRRRPGIRHRAGRRRTDGRATSPPRSRVSSTPASSPRRPRRAASSCASTGSTAVDDPTHRDARRHACASRLASAVPTRRSAAPPRRTATSPRCSPDRAPYAIGAHPHRRVPAAAHRVPQPRRSRSSSILMNLAHRRRRVRVRHPRVPTRLRHRPARHRAPRLRRRLGAAVLLRAAVRPLDGLPAVPARRDPRTLRSHRRHQARDRAKASPAPAGRSPTPRSS